MLFPIAKNAAQRLSASASRHKSLLAVAAVSALMLLAPDVYAVGTSYITAADMTAATNNIEATVGDVKDKTFPIMMLVTGITIMFGLVKKFTKKAAS